MFPGVRLVFRFADSYEINFCHFSAGLGPVARRPHSADTGHQAAQIRGGNLGAERDADPGSSSHRSPAIQERCLPRCKPH